MTDKVLIVSATAPVPVDNGKRAVLHGLLRYFVDRLGSENVHYAVLGRADEEHPWFPGVCHPITKPATAEQVRALGGWVTSRSYTLQEAMLGTPGLRRRVAELVSEIRPTIEVYDTLRLGQHAPPGSSARRRVLYLDDLFSVRYQRILDTVAHGGVDIDPLGGFVTNIPPRLRPLARARAVYVPLLRSERDRIRQREARVVHDFDVSLLVSSREVDQLRDRSGCARVDVLTPSLPTPDVLSRHPAAIPEFVFMGKLDIPHNDDAICSFLADSADELARRRPEARIRVLGRNPSRRLEALAARLPSVSLEGYVEDVDHILAGATAMLAPLRFGSGVKIKVLEALGRGLPVVATSVAAEGIPVRLEGQDGCLVENALSRWPDLLCTLTERRSALGIAARDFYHRTYGTDVVHAQYDRLFGLLTPVVPRQADGSDAPRPAPR